MAAKKKKSVSSKKKASPKPSAKKGVVKPKKSSSTPGRKSIPSATPPLLHSSPTQGRPSSRQVPAAAVTQEEANHSIMTEWQSSIEKRLSILEESLSNLSRPSGRLSSGSKTTTKQPKARRADSVSTADPFDIAAPPRPSTLPPPIIASSNKSKKGEGGRYLQTPVWQTPVGVEARRKEIEKALYFLKKAKSEGEPPRVAPGHRRTFKVTVEDVQKWLAAEKFGSFSLQTIKTDLRAIRDNK